MRALFVLFLSLIPGILSAQFVTASMEIDGLTCSMCSLGVERSIKKLKFIEKVRVDLNTNTASIEFKPNSNVTIKELIKSVFDAGFSVRTLSADFNFQESAKENYFISNNSTFIFLDPPKAGTSKGVKNIKFVEKKFTEGESYKKYKTVIDKTLSHVTINDSYYFVLI